MVVIITIREEHLAWQILTAPDVARQSRVFDRDLVADSRLAFEPELHAVSPHPHVTTLQRRQSVRAIGARVLLVADADVRALEKRDHGGEHAGTGERR